MTIPVETWVLPRPRKPYYPGSFPLYFEKKLLNMLNYPKQILHPFGGHAEYGIRCDLNNKVSPDILANAHYLPFCDNYFDLVLCDPPYNDKLSEEMYNAPKIRYKTFINEAVRVCKPGGYVISYHWVWTTKPVNTKYYKIITILPGQQHRPRICTIFRKD